MTSVSISNPSASIDGVEFTGRRGALEQKFLVHREALEDLEYNVFEKPEELQVAFDRHRGLIGLVAAKALDEGLGGNSTVVLQSLLL